MRKPGYQRWYARLLWKLQRSMTMEGMASEQAILQHNILWYLDQYDPSGPVNGTGDDLFLDKATIATALGATPQGIYDQMFPLKQSGFVSVMVHDLEEMYSLTQSGKAALVDRTIISASARDRMAFLYSGSAIVISILALIVSIIALFKD